jgi:glycosyltransferase involved in cell wall biosynthesis
MVPHRPMKLVVLIPAFNESATVGDVVRGVHTALRNAPLSTPDAPLDYEVVVIDDGSTDQTVLEATVARAVVVSHGGNRGVGAAFQTGVRVALERGADLLVHLDADGQFDPYDIPKLLAPLGAGQADLVTATRRALDRHLQPVRQHVAMPECLAVLAVVVDRVVVAAGELEGREQRLGLRA